MAETSTRFCPPLRRCFLHKGNSTLTPAATASDDPDKVRRPHQKCFQQSCVKGLLNTSRESESSTLNDGFVYLVGIVHVRNDLQIFDGPQLSYDDCGDAYAQ